MDLGPGESIESYPIRTRRRDPSIMALHSRQCRSWQRETGSAHRLFIASARPILRAGFTASPRLAFPISRRLSLDGFGRLVIHSGTADPDCSSTFAILSKPPESAHQHVRTGASVTHGFRNGASSSVKYVTALPSRPARPVRPGHSTRVSRAHSVQEHAHTDRFGECSSAPYVESHN
jgi:hypothetical protein